MNPREAFKNALQDPKIDIDVIGSSNASEIVNLVNTLASDEYVSEWCHTMGEVRYEYHRHKENTGIGLKKLYANGIRGGNPKLTNVYSRSDLAQLIQPQAVSNS